MGALQDTCQTMKVLSVLVIISGAQSQSQSQYYQDPAGAFPALQSNFSSNQEEVDQLGDLTIYRYGPSLSGKWLLWGHDIFGPDSGRTKEYCQKASEELQLTCIIPDFFRGHYEWPMNITTIPSWADHLREDWEFLLVPYLLERGAQSVAVVGTCFGSYITVHTSGDSLGLVKAGVGILPSHPDLMEIFGED